MTRFGFLVLSILEDKGALSKTSAMSVVEIKEVDNLDYEVNTFSKKLKQFVLDGLVNEGIKDGRSNTYFITPKGLKILEEEKNS